MSVNDLKLVWEALKHSEPTHRHYVEAVERHQRAIAIVERELHSQLEPQGKQHHFFPCDPR